MEDSRDSEIYVSTKWSDFGSEEAVKFNQECCQQYGGIELAVTDETKLSRYEMQEFSGFIGLYVTPDYLLSERVQTALLDEYDIAYLAMQPMEGSSLIHIQDAQTHHLPIALENPSSDVRDEMDVNAFASIVEARETGFVLDIQHAYEHDVSLEQAQDLVERLGDRLVAVHVSGQAESEGGLRRHVPVHRADNKYPICSFLQWLSKQGFTGPFILESRFESHEEAERDAELVRDSMVIPHGP